LFTGCMLHRCGPRSWGAYQKESLQQHRHQIATAGE
jgi:hypothetical protein